MLDSKGPGAAGASPDPATSTDLAEELGELMIQLMQRIHAHIDQQCAARNLTRQQALLLALLHHPQPMGALAAELGCDASNMTGMADRLERRGLVERQADPHDRRVKRLALTAAGEALERDMRHRIWGGSPIVSGLSREDQGRLRDLLRRALKASPEPVAPAEARHRSR